MPHRSCKPHGDEHLSHWPGKGVPQGTCCCGASIGCACSPLCCAASTAIVSLATTHASHPCIPLSPARRRAAGCCSRLQTPLARRARDSCRVTESLVHYTRTALHCTAPAHAHPRRRNRHVPTPGTAYGVQRAVDDSIHRVDNKVHSYCSWRGLSKLYSRRCHVYRCRHAPGATRPP